MDRSFRAWGANHKHINFLDVSAECEVHCADTGECGEDCPFAEVRDRTRPALRLNRVGSP